MLQTKDYYRKIAPKGWIWIGAGDHPHTHMFQTGDYEKGFVLLECSEDCLTNGDLEFLAKNNMTCSKERLKELSNRILKDMGHML